MVAVDPPFRAPGAGGRGLDLEVDQLAIDGDGDVGFTEARWCMSRSVASGVAAHGFEDGHDLALGIDVPFAVVSGGVAAVEGGGCDIRPPGAGWCGVVIGEVGEEGLADDAGAHADGFEAGCASEGVSAIGQGVDVAEVEGIDVVMAVVSIEHEGDGELALREGFQCRFR